MSNSNDNNWNRPWSPQEIVDNAENWSLAGDAALLNTLKDFAEVKLFNNIQNNLIYFLLL